MWNWIVRSLRGNRSSAGAFHYLVDEVPIYDIFALFKRLVEVLEQITICSVDDELELVIKMDYNPLKQNVFSYLGDLRKAIKRLHDVCERLPVDGRITLPDSYVKSRHDTGFEPAPYGRLDHFSTNYTIYSWTSIKSRTLYQTELARHVTKLRGPGFESGRQQC